MTTTARASAIVLFLFFAGVPGASEPAVRDVFEQAQTAASPAESIRILEKGLPDSGEWRFLYLMEITRQYGNLDDWSSALTAVNRITPDMISPEHADRYAYLLALARENTGDAGAAEQTYHDRIFGSEAREPLLYLGYLRLSSAGAEKTLARMDAMLPDLRKTDPDSWLLSRYLGGLVAVREGQWAFAADLFSLVLDGPERAPEEYLPWASFYHGWSLYRTGTWEKAYGALSLYLEKFPDHERVWQASTAAAFCAMQTGRDPLRHADRAVSRAPTPRDRAEGLLFKASILLDRGDHAGAATLLLSVADGTATSGLTVFSPRARFMLADAAFSRRDFAEAEKHWLAVYRDFSDDPLAEEALFRAGEQWYLQDRADRAVQLFTRYRQNHPNGKYTDLVLKNGGEALRTQGKTDLAILWWESFITRFPKSRLMPRVLNDLVSAYRDSGDYAAALRMARTYANDYPREAEADRIAGEIETLELLNRGAAPDTAAVAVEYRRLGGAETGEGRSKALVLARIYLADAGRHAEGRRILEEVTATLPRNTAMLSRTDRAVYAGAEMLLGNHLRETGDFSAASRAFLSAGTLFAPIDGERAAEALYGAVDSFLRTDRRGDAEKALETMRSSWSRSVWTQRAARLLGAE